MRAPTPKGSPSIYYTSVMLRHRFNSAIGLLCFALVFATAQEHRPRARDIGLVVGILPPGALNAITDIAGVLVGHATLIRGDDIRTGVTAVVPRAGNLFREKVHG